MPTYQYQCTECSEGLEAVQKFTEDALTECPSCQGRLRKVFSAVGVVFKGSGFYRTDSRGSSSAPSNGSNSAKNSSTATKSGSSGSSNSSSESSGSTSSTASTSSSGSTSGAGTSVGSSAV